MSTPTTGEQRQKDIAGLAFGAIIMVAFSVNIIWKELARRPCMHERVE